MNKKKILLFSIFVISTILILIMAIQLLSKSLVNNKSDSKYTLTPEQESDENLIFQSIKKRDKAREEDYKNHILTSLRNKYKEDFVITSFNMRNLWYGKNYPVFELYPIDKGKEWKFEVQIFDIKD